MKINNWFNEFPGAITICDTEGVILDLNIKASEVFKDEGGTALIGQNALACHPEQARRKMLELLANQQKNVYTIEKNGIKKLIYQTPWFQDGRFAGLLELALEIPEEMPHFIRDTSG